MSYFLAWKEHYKPEYNYLTLDYCALIFGRSSTNKNQKIKHFIYKNDLKKPKKFVFRVALNTTHIRKRNHFGIAYFCSHMIR